jgi:hypothetical protein
MVLLVSLLGGAFYYFQKEIYVTTASFKSIAHETSSPMQAIASLFGEQGEVHAAAEVLGLNYSNDFLHRLSETLYNHPQFKQFNYGSPKKKRSNLGIDILKQCNGSDCAITKLSNALPALFKIQEDKKIKERFLLEIKTQNFQTTNELTKIISNEIQQTRLTSMSYFLKEQRKTSEKLLALKEAEIGSKKLMEMEKERGVTIDRIDTVDKKIFAFNNLYYRQKLNLSDAEAKYEITQETLKKSVNQGLREKSNRIEKLKSRIVQLTEDISALELSVSGVTLTDDKIIAQLRTELKQTKAKLKKEGYLERSISNIDNFIEKSGRVYDSNEYSFKVNQIKVQDMEGTLSNLKQERKTLLDRKISLDLKIEQLKPTFNYVKVLKEKLIRLDLLESTIASDIVFEKYHRPIEKRKQFSKWILFLIVLFGSCIAILFYCGLRFVFDDRIFDEHQLLSEFSDLPVIGRTPSLG